MLSFTVARDEEAFVILDFKGTIQSNQATVTDGVLFLLPAGNIYINLYLYYILIMKM